MKKRRGATASLLIGDTTLRRAVAGRKEARAAISRTPARSKPLGAPLSGLPVVRLDDLRQSGAWMAPPADLALERFAVSFPSQDVTRLAYDREEP
ncbi:MAG: hypothetical protein ACRERD_13370 [Candidatus Binatia bacterium]